MRVPRAVLHSDWDLNGHRHGHALGRLRICDRVHLAIHRDNRVMAWIWAEFGEMLRQLLTLIGAGPFMAAASALCRVFAS
jgi:hypothetical protein